MNEVELNKQTTDGIRIEKEVEMEPVRPAPSLTKSTEKVQKKSKARLEEPEEGKTSFTVNFEYILHSSMLIAGKLLAKAVAAYNSLFTVNEKDRARIYENLGKKHMKKGQHNSALDAFNKAIDAGIKTPQIYYLMGKAYFQTSAYDKAIGCFKESLKIVPKNTDALFQLGSTYLKIKEYDKCISTLIETTNSSRANSEIYYKLGIAYDKKGNADDAIKALKKAIEMSPDEIKYYQHLGFVYQTKGDVKESAKCFKKVLELEGGEEMD